MSMDIILYAPDKATIAAFGKAHPPANPLLQADGKTRRGVRYCWWGGSGGKFMTTPGVPGAEPGDPWITPPTYLPGVVMLLHIHSAFFAANEINPGDPDYEDPVDPDNIEQWERNRVVRYIKENGVWGEMGSAPNKVPYYEIDGTRLFRPKDVNAFIAAKGVPGHTWVGGNAY